MNKTPRSLDDFASSIFDDDDDDGLHEDGSLLTQTTGVGCVGGGFTNCQGLQSFNIARDDERQDWKAHYDAVCPQSKLMGGQTDAQRDGQMDAWTDEQPAR